MSLLKNSKEKAEVRKSIMLSLETWKELMNLKTEFNLSSAEELLKKAMPAIKEFFKAK